MAGVYQIVRNAPLTGNPHRRVGDALLVLSGVVWALYNFTTRGVSGKHPALVVVHRQTLAGAAGFLVLSLTEIPGWSPPAAGTWLCLALLALFCSMIAFALYARGLGSLTPSTAVGVLNLVPVAGLLAPVVLLRESLDPVQLVGGGIVIVAVMAAVRVGRRDEVAAGRKRSEGHPA